MSDLDSYDICPLGWDNTEFHYLYEAESFEEVVDMYLADIPDSERCSLLGCWLVVTKVESGVERAFKAPALRQTEREVLGG